MKRVALATAMSVLALILSVSGDTEAPPSVDATEHEFAMKPIGTVLTTDAGSTLVLKPECEATLLGLDGFSHVWVLWWFDRNDTPAKRSILQVHPRGNRSNPLGLASGGGGCNR